MSAPGRATSSSGRTDADPLPDRGAVPPLVLALRPLGYLVMGAVWGVLAIVVLALGPGVLVAMAVTGSVPVLGIWESLVSSPSEIVAYVLCVPLLALLWGPGVLWFLPNATWPLAALSFAYVGRSLRPGFAGEPLSRTGHAARGTTIGLPTTGGIALSLQPVRPSRTTTAIMRWYVSGWLPTGRSFVAMLPAGFGYLLAFAALASDPPGVVRIVSGLGAAALFGWSAVLARRAWVARFAAGTTSPTVRAVTSLSARERQERLDALHRARRERERRSGSER